MTLTLLRWCSTPMGTFGRLTLGAQEWFTVERPWQQNAPGVSCIPAGEYVLQLGMFYAGDGIGGKIDYPAYELQEVPGRAGIKIHRANLASQVKGCIALGKELGCEGGKWAVLRSREAFDEFMVAARAAAIARIAIRWAPVEP